MNKHSWGDAPINPVDFFWYFSMSKLNIILYFILFKGVVVTRDVLCI